MEDKFFCVVTMLGNNPARVASYVYFDDDHEEMGVP